MKLLLIEETPGNARIMAKTLRENRYALDLASDSVEAGLLAKSGIYDLVIIDVIRSARESLAFLKNLRLNGIHTPLMVLLERNENIELGTRELVEFLDCGADDYLVKPCDRQLLLAHVRALGRRAADMWDNDILEYGRMRCTPSRCEVFSRGQVTRLTLKEMQILECLIRNRNCVLTRDQLSHRIWGYNSSQDNNNLEVHMSYLRKKLKNAGAGVQIQTIRGVGYCLREETILAAGNKP